MNDIEHIVTTPHSVLAIATQFDPSLDRKVLKLPICTIVDYYNGAVYQRDVLKFQKLVEKKPEKEVQRLLGLIKRRCELFIKQTKKLNRFWNSTSLKQLYKHYLIFIDCYKAFRPILLTPIVLERVIERQLKNRIKRDFEKHLGNLAYPTRESEATRMERAILTLAIKKKQGQNIEKNLEKLHKEFGWLSTHFFLGKPLSIKDCLKRVDEAARGDPKRALLRLTQNQLSARKRYQESMSQLRPGPELQKWIARLREVVFLRTFRLDVLNKGFCQAYPLFKEIARRFGITVEELVSATPLEVKKWFYEGKRPNREVLKDRLMGYGAVKTAGGFKLISRKEAEKQLVRLKKAKIEKVEKICGFSAQPGIAKGRVRLILNKEQLKKFKEREILVAPMTTPDYIPAIKKAIAVVTDIGGITSHAAVISRELGKPCIIGTKVATKVLKDGDLIEVDATKGLVKKIRN